MASAGGAVADLADLLVELGGAGQAGAGDRLVGADHQRAQARPRVSRGLSTGMATIVVQLGLATMFFGMDVEGVGVDLGDDQRDVGVHPPGRGVVDHHRPAVGHPRGEALEVLPPAENSTTSRPE